MGKTSVKVNCIDQRLLVSSGPVIASGGHNEDEIVFSFCPLWNGFEKVATFYRDKDHVYHAILESDKCVIPWEVLTDAGEFYFGVFGVKNDVQRTSHVVKYKVAEGSISEDTEPSDPTPDIYTQIISAHNDVSTRLQTHVHGNISRDGKVGTVPGRILVTTAGGLVQADTPATIRSLLGLSVVATSGSYKDLNDTPVKAVDNTVSPNGVNPVSGAAVASHVAEQIAAILNFEEVMV